MFCFQSIRVVWFGEIVREIEMFQADMMKCPIKSGSIILITQSHSKDDITPTLIDSYNLAHSIQISGKANGSG
jgi:hypothetical protein